VDRSLFVVCLFALLTVASCQPQSNGRNIVKATIETTQGTIELELYPRMPRRPLRILSGLLNKATTTAWCSTASRRILSFREEIRPARFGRPQHLREGVRRRAQP